MAIGVGGALTSGAKTGTFDMVTETAKNSVNALKEED